MKTYRPFNFLAIASPFASWRTVSRRGREAGLGFLVLLIVVSCSSGPPPRVLTPAEIEANRAQVQLSLDHDGCLLSNRSDAEPGSICIEAGEAYFANERTGELAITMFTKGCEVQSARCCERLGDAHAAGIGVYRNTVDSARATGYWTKACELGGTDACAKLAPLESGDPEKDYQTFSTQLISLQVSPLATLKGPIISRDPPVYTCTKRLLGFRTSFEQTGKSTRVHAASNTKRPLPPPLERVLSQQISTAQILLVTVTDSDTDAGLRESLAKLQATMPALRRIVAFSKEQQVTRFMISDGGSYDITFSALAGP